MLFTKRDTPVHQTEAPPSPFDRAKSEWDQRIGAPVAQAANWRYMAFGALGLAAFMGMGWFYQASKSTFEVLYVRVADNGSFSPPMPVADAMSKPQDPEIRFAIQQWLEWVRTKPADEYIIRTNWAKAYKYLLPSAAKKLTAFAQQNNPLDKVGEDTRTIDIETVFRRSDASFEVRWIERLFTNGALIRTDHYSGIFMVERRKPSNIDDARDNPLSLFFSDFNWNRDRAM